MANTGTTDVTPTEDPTAAKEIAEQSVREAVEAYHAASIALRRARAGRTRRAPAR